QTFSYPHRDAALTDIGSKRAKDILDSSFTSRWSSSTPITPTLLYVYEDRYRSLNDSPESKTSGAVAWSGSQLTVDLNGTLAQTDAGMSWKPYARSAAGWSPLDIQPYWDELDRRYANTADTDDSPESAAGKIAAN